MELTLIKSLHSGDPDVIQNMWTCKCLMIFRVRHLKCYSGKSYCMLILLILLWSFCSLAECMSAIHWGSHVEVPNSCRISSSNSSLLECSPVTWVRFPAETCLSRGAIVEDGDDLGSLFIVRYFRCTIPSLIIVNTYDSDTWIPIQSPLWSEIGIDRGNKI